RSILGVGPDFEYEVLSREDWIARRLVASKFCDRRVFICGDAAHVWMPLGGFGMSAGIADAANLARKLAGVLHGWAMPEILDAYEAERQPITEQASPIIAYDGEQAPIYTMGTFTSSTVPGCRAPHVWLEGGRSLYDAMGPDYTLLRLDPTTSVQGIVRSEEHTSEL